MKNLKILFLFAGILLTQNALAAIYGPDDRKDIFQVPWLKPLAQSVAISVPKDFIKTLPNGNFQMLSIEKLAGSIAANACQDEKFGNQPTIGNCTGFLVSDRHLITAGHCVINTGIVENDTKSPYCEDFRWYFDFNTDATGKTTAQNIPKNRLYGCRNIIRAEVIDGGNDFAVVELDRSVSSDMKPLKMNSNRPTIGTSVYTIGHPAGIPAKYSGLSTVFANKNPIFVESYMDTQGGNSGGPVFNNLNQVVGILVSGHQIDFYQDPKGCYRWNKCNANGTQCKENSTVSTLQVSNYVQLIETALKYLPQK